MRPRPLSLSQETDPDRLSNLIFLFSDLNNKSAKSKITSKAHDREDNILLDSLFYLLPKYL